MRLRLRLVKVVDFRFSERTNFDIETKRHKLELKSGEVVCFISLGRDQIIFVSQPRQMEVPEGTKLRKAGPPQVLDSRRLRIEGGVWSRLMMQNYANEVGIEIDGFRRLEEIFAAQAA